MKRWLKRIALGILLLIGVGIVWGWIAHEPLPEGTSPKEADVLAEKMLTALNAEAYKNTRYLEWSYQGGKNQYKWDKTMGRCEVRWDTNEVQLNLNRPEISIVRKDGKRIQGNEAQVLIEKALAYFNNDSFWLVAPYKVFDAGTHRSLVALEDGSQGLLVSYSAGGTTPGDHYLWLLDAENQPKSYKMWVQILPIGGLEASWDSWITTESGAVLPNRHQLGPLTLSMGNVKGYNE